MRLTATSRSVVHEGLMMVFECKRLTICMVRKGLMMVCECKGLRAENHSGITC